MNLPRLRELHTAWYNGSIRTDELTELRDMLPEVLDNMSKTITFTDGALHSMQADYRCDNNGYPVEHRPRAVFVAYKAVNGLLRNGKLP